MLEQKESILKELKKLKEPMLQDYEKEFKNQQKYPIPGHAMLDDYKYNLSIKNETLFTSIKNYLKDNQNLFYEYDKKVTTQVDSEIKDDMYELLLTIYFINPHSNFIEENITEGNKKAIFTGLKERNGDKLNQIKNLKHKIEKRISNDNKVKRYYKKYWKNYKEYNLDKLRKFKENITSNEKYKPVKKLCDDLRNLNKATREYLISNDIKNACVKSFSASVRTMIAREINKDRQKLKGLPTEKDLVLGK